MKLFVKINSLKSIITERVRVRRSVRQNRDSSFIRQAFVHSLTHSREEGGENGMNLGALLVEYICMKEREGGEEGETEKGERKGRDT